MYILLENSFLYFATVALSSLWKEGYRKSKKTNKKRNKYHFIFIAKSFPLSPLSPIPEITTFLKLVWLFQSMLTNEWTLEGDSLNWNLHPTVLALWSWVSSSLTSDCVPCVFPLYNEKTSPLLYGVFVRETKIWNK